MNIPRNPDSGWMTERAEEGDYYNYLKGLANRKARESDKSAIDALTFGGICAIQCLAGSYLVADSAANNSMCKGVETIAGFMLYSAGCFLLVTDLWFGALNDFGGSNETEPKASLKNNINYAWHSMKESRYYRKLADRIKKLDEADVFELFEGNRDPRLLDSIMNDLGRYKTFQDYIIQRKWERKRQIERLTEIAREDRWRNSRDMEESCY